MYCHFYQYDTSCLLIILFLTQGCRERTDSFKPNKPYVAFTSSDYGYTRMHIINSTHIDMEQVSDDKVKIWIGDIV